MLKKQRRNWHMPWTFSVSLICLWSIMVPSINHLYMTIFLPRLFHFRCVVFIALLKHGIFRINLTGVVIFLSSITFLFLYIVNSFSFSSNYLCYYLSYVTATLFKEDDFKRNSKRMVSMSAVIQRSLFLQLELGLAGSNV